MYNNDARRRRQADGTDADLVSADVNNLWPYSTIKAGVLVLNGAKSGALGDVIEFTPPEGCKHVRPTQHHDIRAQCPY